MTLLAVHATGLLRDFHAAGVLGLADVHTARRVAALGGEPDETVQLAIALTVRALRLGSVCVDLADISRTATTDDGLDADLPWPEPAPWLAACARSAVIAPGRPLTLDHGLLYLSRYWEQEQCVRRALRERAAAPPPVVDIARLRADLDRLFGDCDPGQRLAAAVAALRWVTVLAGGPGTGKTTTIAKLLDALSPEPLRIALAAPTGKAAARLAEAVGRPASTLHRLLGRRPGTHTRFRHDRTNRLPYDVIVVDETSMVSLPLMAQLIDAVRPDARLILVGDPDQLASVEAGAVLGDIVRAAGQPAQQAELAAAGHHEPVVNGVVTLAKTWRFGGVIAALADAVRAGDDDRVVELLHSGDPAVEFTTPDDPALRDDVLATLSAVTAAAADGDAAAALDALQAHRLLCAHRTGPYGVTCWNVHTERWLGAPQEVGRPLLVTANDYDTGLYNGDTGVLVATADGPRAAFSRNGEVALVPPSRLADVQTLYAMTVHRSQGSQFERISLILPPAESPLLTRELFYTAITRARSGLRVLGTEAAVRAAVTRPVARASGLRESLARTS